MKTMPPSHAIGIDASYPKVERKRSADSVELDMTGSEKNDLLTRKRL